MSETETSPIEQPEKIESIDAEDERQSKRHFSPLAELKSLIHKEATKTWVIALAATAVAAGADYVLNHSDSSSPYYTTLDGSGFVDASAIDFRVAENMLKEMGYSEQEAVELARLPGPLLRIILSGRVEINGGSNPEDLLKFSEMVEEEDLLDYEVIDGKIVSYMYMPDMVTIAVSGLESNLVSTKDQRGVDIFFHYKIQGKAQTVKVASPLSRLQVEAAVDTLREGMKHGKDCKMSLIVFEDVPGASGVYLSSADKIDNPDKMHDVANEYYRYSTPELVLPFEDFNPLWYTRPEALDVDV